MINFKGKKCLSGQFGIHKYVPHIVFGVISVEFVGKISCQTVTLKMYIPKRWGMPEILCLGKAFQLCEERKLVLVQLQITPVGTRVVSNFEPPVVDSQFSLLDVTREGCAFLYSDCHADKGD